ncbi:MAG: hypothetical protein FWG35_03575, partial [Spirochaetaceae bacterium]|nr:hypothetical protein [Spirochaetaceae bacterium]
TEDEAQQGSYLNRHYQIICLNGITQNRQIEDGIINENMKYIETLNLSEEESEIIRSAIKYLENTE